MKYLLRTFIILFLLCLGCSLFAQDKTTPRKRKLSQPEKQTDSTGIFRNDPLMRSDTSQTEEQMQERQREIRARMDSINAANAVKGQSGIDTIITYSAKDTVVFNLGSKMMRLRGNAVVNFKEQKLEAEVIEIYFDESTLRATGVRDSNQKLQGYPKFTDKGQSFVGEQILYNFETRQGTITYGETELTEGYYFGTKIKKISEDEAFIQEGRYTTCDEPHPHFFFGSPEMKKGPDRIFLDPLYFYVADMPVFMVPFGLFFPNKTGRQSGLIIPTFFFSRDRGVALENLGVFFALSEYFDTQILTKFYSKGGYNIENTTRWKLLNTFDGQFTAGYGITRFNPDQEFNTNWNFSLNHRHTLTPQTNINARMQFSSQNYNTNVYSNLQNRIQQEISSNASISHSFDNGADLSLGFSRSQNIINDTWTQDFPTVSYSLPSWNILKDVTSSDNILSNLSLSYSVDAGYTYIKSIERYDSVQTDQDTVLRATPVFGYDYRSRISHHPGISISPKLGYFTITPSIGFSANNYFRRLTKHYDPARDTVTESIQNGFFTEYTYSMGVGVSTRLFGLVQPEIFGLNAIRHEIRPEIRYSYTPDLSDPSFGFWDSYTDTAGNLIKYSRFEKDGGGLASNAKYQLLSFALRNSIDVKIDQGDTVEDRTLNLLTFDLSSAYNFEADSLKLSDVNFSFRTPNFANLSLSGSGSFTLYDEDREIDRNGRYTGRFVKVDRFRIAEGKGLALLKNLNLSLSTSFSSQGFSLGTMAGEEEVEQEKKDSLGLGERFQQRLEDEVVETDVFGDNTPGYSTLSIPWRLDFGLLYSYGLQPTHDVNQRLNLTTSFSFELTNTWHFQGTFQYDFINHELVYPIFNIRKDLHCWELLFEWYPSGTYTGFNLRLNIKAPQLQDLKIEKKDTPYYR